MNKLILFFIVLVVLSSNTLAGVVLSDSAGVHSKFSGKAFVLNIGIDHYASYASQSNLQYCQSDADYFINYLKRDTCIKELKLYNFRDNSTKSQIVAAFNDIAQNVTNNDLFVFYFAGMSFDNSLLLTDEKISYDDIFVYSQNIFAERQVYISDACNGLEFGMALKNKLQQKPLEKITTKINRIIISLETMAYEIPQGSNLKDTSFAGGQLTGSLSNSKYPLTSLFNELNHSDKFWTQFKYELYETYQKEFPDLIIFSEQDFLSEVKNEKTRGPQLVNTVNIENEKKIITKGESLCIVVGNQNFEELARLPNVMNDATKIESVLSNAYNTVTIFLKDISYKSFLDTLNHIHDNFIFDEGSQLLLFCASHGFKDKFGIGYLCFADSKKEDIARTSFELQNLKRYMTSFGATNTMMIMDICHSGLAFDENNCTNPVSIEIPLKSPIFTTPFGASSPAYKNFLNQKSNLYFGSSRDQEAADGLGQNSPFASVLISFLESNKLPVIDSYHLQKSIEKKVMEEGAISFPAFCTFNCKPDGRFLFIRK